MRVSLPTCALRQNTSSAFGRQLNGNGLATTFGRIRSMHVGSGVHDMAVSDFWVTKKRANMASFSYQMYATSL